MSRAHVYLIGWKSDAPDGVVKVGITRHLRERMAHHGRGRIAWAHIFPAFTGAAEIELAAIRALAAAGKPIRAWSHCEEFRGLTKSEAIAIVRACIARHLASRQMRLAEAERWGRFMADLLAPITATGPGALDEAGAR